MTEPRQWQRRAQLVIGKSGSGLMIEDLRIAFEVEKTLESAPNTAVIKIWNLTPDNIARIKKEFDEVLLNAGYLGALRLVFRGNIQHAFVSRDGNDTIMEIEAGDGDKDFRTAVMNETLAAGTSNADLVERAVSSFSGGTNKGHIATKSTIRRRGKVISGNTRSVLNDLSRESGANWSIQDGKLTIVPSDGLLPNEAVLINADTGMIGSPETTDKGITVKCLLNPLISINSAIHLDRASIVQREKKAAPEIRDDGLYKVVKLTHRGDTRSGDWVSEIDCVALGGKTGGKK